jgi:hypothetical protein
LEFPLLEDAAQGVRKRLSTSLGHFVRAARRRFRKFKGGSRVRRAGAHRMQQRV